MALKNISDSTTAQGLCKWVIDEDLTIYEIEQIKKGLSDDIDIYENFELDLSNVNEIDSAGIQLLLALKHALTKETKKFTLTSVSISVSQLMNTYGIGGDFTVGEVA